MNFHTLVLYIIIVTAIVYCPGPMTMFTMATSMKVGPRATLPALFGGSTAYISQLIIVSLGLGLLLQHYIFLFNFIKWLGAAYLIYLGIKQWTAGKMIIQEKLEKKTFYSHGKMYLRGFIVGATNPKSIIVFTALFPQFINATAPRSPQLLILSCLFLFLQFSSALFYAFFGSKVFKWLQTKQKEKIQQRITGTILISAGALLASVKK